MYCKKCGQEIDTTGNFCQNCGAPINETESPSNPSQTEKPKKPKKPVYKRWWFWALVVCFVLGSFIERTDTQNDSSPVIETQSTTAPASTTVETLSETVPETTGIIDIYTAAALIESFVKDNFENYDISCEENTITVNLWMDGLTTSAILASSGNEEALASWNTVVEGAKSYSTATSETVDSLGLDDVVVVVNILNDQNTEKVLLSILNGVVVYDSVNGQ